MEVEMKTDTYINEEVSSLLGLSMSFVIQKVNTIK